MKNNLIERLKALKNRLMLPYRIIKSGIPSRKILGYCHPTAQINYPVYGLCKEYYFPILK